MTRLLLHHTVWVDGACTADFADLGEDSGHRVLRVVRKSGRKAKIPLTPAMVAALDAYLADPARRAGAGEWRQLSGPVSIATPLIRSLPTWRDSIADELEQVLWASVTG